MTDGMGCGSAPEGPGHQGDHHQQAAPHVQVVAGAPPVRPGGVESHRAQYRGCRQAGGASAAEAAQWGGR